MSHANRSEPRGDARRTRRQVRIEAVQALEERKLLAPVVSVGNRVATFTAATTPTNAFLGTVSITEPAGVSPALLTSVSQLTSANSFGGDIVKIEAGPGGDFGKGVYAISRGAGDNADATERSSDITAPINKPGVIYRVDPATGKTSVFFDLNTVQSQIPPPGGNAANGGSPGTGLVNYYDIAFDPEGIFDGKTSMFVSSLSQTDPNKNVIYRIGPDGSFLGTYVQFTAGGAAQNFTRQPSAVLVPPVEQQNFLKGLLVGNGNTLGTGTTGTVNGFAALFFDANQFRPGTNLSGTNLPNGVTTTPLTLGPQVALTAANTSYRSPDYSVFTDFGTPGAGGVTASPGLSGVQGLGGELAINVNGVVYPFPIPAASVGAVTAPATGTTASGVDQASAIATPFRRFQDATFDHYGYFSYGLSNAAGAGGGGVNPIYQGSLFVSDLAPGLAVSVTPIGGVAPNNVPIAVPIQGPGAISVTADPVTGAFTADVTNGNTTGGGGLGGRIVRISPGGVVTPFAEGFHTNNNQDASSFLGSELSISFSADGTTLYASDDDGVWQFKTVTSIAGATSGSLVGLNDLRTLGVPYDGQDSAVAIVDTGVDSFTPNFRGRVSEGLNVLNNSPGNDDTSAAARGHGTLLAGVIAQFVPQATLTPVNVFTPGQVVPVAGSAGGTTTLANATSAQNIYMGFDYLAKNPFVSDPIRPNKVDRVIAANIGFGTTTTYPVETAPFKAFPQVTVAFKNQFKKFRDLGIVPIAAAGQFGTPQGASVGGSATGGDVTGISFPAVLNEVVSVTGSYPFPYVGTARSVPTDPGLGVVPRPPGPYLLFGSSSTTIANTLTSAGTAGLVAGSDALIFKDKILASSNRSLTTDYTAPELDIPTWDRSVSLAAGASLAGSVGATAGNPLTGFNDFQQGGTSLSSAIVTGSFAMVASALDYWTDIARNNGVTVDGYLTTAAGVNQLNFGHGGIEDLSAYTNPDSINSILQWTAVPATDAPNTLDTVNPPTLFGQENYRNFARIDVGNAIAAIEGSIALNYLFAHGTFDIIDANKNGLITAQELQNFQDDAANTGMAEAGVMARFLGGNARIPITGQQPTAAGESPDQPDVLARRFNFIEYAADGEQNGAVSIDQLRQLAHTLLPSPDAFTIVDRQRASRNGFLLDPKPLRNISDLQHTVPTYAFIPKRQVARFKNISPAKFGVGRGQLPGTIGPAFTLFADGGNHAITKGAKVSTKATTPAAAPTATRAAATTSAATATTPSTANAASTSTPPNGAQAVSPATVNAQGANNGNTYFNLLTSLSQGTPANARATPATSVSPVRTAGSPAAATASGVGSVSGSATPPASSMAQATSDMTSGGATSHSPTAQTTPSVANDATSQVQALSEAAAQSAQNASDETRPQPLAAHARHAAPIAAPQAPVVGHSRRAAQARASGSDSSKPFRGLRRLFGR